MTIPSVDEEIGKFIEEIKECDEIVGIILFGSAATGKMDELSDIDLLVCVDSPNFHTPQTAYEVIAPHVSDRMGVTVKTIQEFSPRNFVTMHLRFIQHLYNVGKVVYRGSDLEENYFEKKIDEMWKGLKMDSRIENAYRVAFSLAVRHTVLELYRGNFEMIKRGKFFKRPPSSFWQNSIHLLNVEIRPEDEGNIVEMFNKIIPTGSVEYLKKVRNSMIEINEEYRTNGYQLSPALSRRIIESYVEFKNTIEGDMWALNEYLNLKLSLE